MNREIEEKRVVVIPVLVGRCDNLPGFLKGKLWIDMTTDRKLNENFPNFLSCFNVSFNKDNIKESFTDFNWTATYIIEKLERGSEIERFEILENIGDKDTDLFELDVFKDCLAQLVKDKTGNSDLILAILDIAQHKTTSKQFDKKVFALLECNPNNRLTEPILNYLYSKHLDLLHPQHGCALTADYHTEHILCKVRPAKLLT